MAFGLRMKRVKVNDIMTGFKPKIALCSSPTMTNKMETVRFFSALENIKHG
jgi:hypothetical protein